MMGLTEFSLRFQSALGTDPNDQLFFEGQAYQEVLSFLDPKKGRQKYLKHEVVHTFPDLSNSPFYSLNDQRHEFKIVNVLKAGRWDQGCPY